MIGKSYKFKKNFRGGHQKYRSPLIFNGRKIKEKKPIKIPKFIWKYLFYGIVFGLVVYLIFFSEKFKIKDVMVEGNGLVTSERLTSYVPKNTNIFRLNISKTKRNILAENTEIKDVQIYRGIPNAAKIVVMEYDNKLIWQTNNEKYYLSSQGRVTRKLSGSDPVNLPIIVDTKNLPVKLGQNIVSPHFVSFVLNLYGKFFEVTNIKPTYFEIPETTFDINLRTEQNFYVKFNTMRSSTKQLNDLKNILVSKRPEVAEYVDLRIDGWAYYK